MCFIVYGSRGITTTPDSGTFECPICQQRTCYKMKRVRKFGTLYYIPIMPEGILGEYIECDWCLNSFKLEVLELGKSTSRKAGTYSPD